MTIFFSSKIKIYLSNKKGLGGENLNGFDQFWLDHLYHFWCLYVKTGCWIDHFPSREERFEICITSEITGFPRYTGFRSHLGAYWAYACFWGLKQRSWGMRLGFLDTSEQILSVRVSVHIDLPQWPPREMHEEFWENFIFSLGVSPSPQEQEVEFSVCGHPVPPMCFVGAWGVALDLDCYLLSLRHVLLWFSVC